METKKNTKNEGLVEGWEEEKISIINSILNNNLVYELISNISGKSIDEIKEIEKSIWD